MRTAPPAEDSQERARKLVRPTMEAGDAQRSALGMRPHNIYFFETQPSVALNGGRGCPSSPSVVKAEPETGSSGLVFRAAAIVGLEDFKNEIGPRRAH